MFVIFRTPAAEIRFVRAVHAVATVAVAVGAPRIAAVAAAGLTLLLVTGDVDVVRDVAAIVMMMKKAMILAIRPMTMIIEDAKIGLDRGVDLDPDQETGMEVVVIATEETEAKALNVNDLDRQTSVGKEKKGVTLDDHLVVRIGMIIEIETA